MKCSLCGKEIKGYGHNGCPLVDGKVCDDCQTDVIKARMLNMINREKGINNETE